MRISLRLLKTQPQTISVTFYYDTYIAITLDLRTIPGGVRRLCVPDLWIGHLLAWFLTPLLCDFVIADGERAAYVLEHLATFTVTRETGIVYPADGMRRLLQLEKTNGQYRTLFIYLHIVR